MRIMKIDYIFQLEKYKMEEQNKEEQRDQREEIRKEIKRDARNLCTYVVNTCVEYKEELLQMEVDVQNLKADNKNLEGVNREINRNLSDLKRIITNLREENLLLYTEYENSQSRIRNIIERFGSGNMCYNCDHFVDCGDIYLCVYCQKWVCKCCVNSCTEENSCPILICSSCQQTHPKCPSHTPGITKMEELITYYINNK